MKHMSATEERFTEERFAISMTAAPTGLVSFLFTDIEGSTVRWDRAPEAMQQAVRRHDHIMRAVIAAHHGHVFKTIGDAFCAVFARTEDTVGAAIAAQRALAAEDFSAVDGVRVRMAIHRGVSDERDGDYFGPTLNRVARLLATGHGGQVLLSDAAHKAAAALAPAACDFLTLGRHRLKDLTEPEDVYQLVADGLQPTFPPLNSLSARGTNLPQRLTELIGRDADVGAIGALLRTARLVTIFGTGGLGKTRCALQAAADASDRFKDGVWFVDLAPVADPALVAGTIALALGVPESASRAPLESLVAHLRAKEALLILDNCEHLVGACADITTTVLAACPKVKVIATSREALRVHGEQVYGLPPLAGTEAIALFVDRAQAKRRDFELGDANRADITEICRRLDGLPLAIELAAARINVLSPRQLVQRLDERFRILSGGDRTALPRQQTLRALLDWSYDLLEPREQAVFRRLACFAGGFTAETAAEICCGDDLDELDVFECIGSLLEKSLIVSDSVGDERRCRMLESLRAYAEGKLSESGEAPDTRLRHARSFAERAERMKADYDVLPHDAWLCETELEIDNLRAALTCAFAPHGDVLAGQRIAATLDRLLMTHASVEAARWVETAQRGGTEATPPQVVARLALAEAALGASLNRFRPAHVAAVRARELFAALGDERGMADADRFAARALIRLGEIDAAEPMLRSVLDAYGRIGVQRIGGVLRDLAVIRGMRGDLDGAREWFARALTVFEEGADAESAAVTAGALAEAEFQCGSTEAALLHAEQGLATVRSMGRDRVVAAFEGNIAAYLNVAGDHEQAAQRALRSFAAAHPIAADACVAFALQHFAAAQVLGDAAGEDRRAEALRLLGYVDAQLGRLDVVREYTEQQEYDRARAGAEALLGEARARELLEEGAHWTEAVALTPIMGGRAEPPVARIIEQSR